MIIHQNQIFSKKWRFWQVWLSTGNEPLGSETFKLRHQTGECVLSLLQLMESFNLKNPWYGILAKRDTPLSKFLIWFLALISAVERFGQKFRDAHITTNHIPPSVSFGCKSWKSSILWNTIYLMWTEQYSLSSYYMCQLCVNRQYWRGII